MTDDVRREAKELHQRHVDLLAQLSDLNKQAKRLVGSVKTDRAWARVYELTQATEQDAQKKHRAWHSVRQPGRIVSGGLPTLGKKRR